MPRVVGKDDEGTARCGRRGQAQVVTGRAKGNGMWRGRDTEHRDCRCGGGGHWMQSRERGTRAAVHKPLGSWQTGFLGVNKGEFTDEAAATFTMVNGWSPGSGPKGQPSLHQADFTAWTKLGRGSGNLRGEGNLVVGYQDSQRRRRCEQWERPTEWQVRGSPSGTGTVK